MMARNWNKEKILFEQKCNRVLVASQQEQLQKPILTNDQVKTRQQRFDQLKQRLLQNSTIRNRKASDRSAPPLTKALT